jgi:hypothetical protein
MVFGKAAVFAVHFEFDDSAGYESHFGATYAK